MNEPTILGRSPEACVACLFVCSCDEHVARIERFPPSLRTLELTDEISNLLCSVIDVANVCQGVRGADTCATSRCIAKRGP